MPEATAPKRIESATVRFPNNATDFLMSVNGTPIGYFTLQLGGGDDTYKSFIIGQRVIPGTEAHYEDKLTRIIDGQLYVLNAVYQFNHTEDFIVDPVLDTAELEAALLDVFAEKSGVKEPREDFIVMVSGPIHSERVGNTINYMVMDLVFSSAAANH